MLSVKFKLAVSKLRVPRRKPQTSENEKSFAHGGEKDGVFRKVHGRRMTPGQTETAYCDDIVDAFHHPDVLDVTREIGTIKLALKAHSNTWSSSGGGGPSKSRPVSCHSSTITLVNTPCSDVLKSLSICGTLGRGASGTVYQARVGQTGPLLALKVIAKRDAAVFGKSSVLNEQAAIARLVDVPGVLQLEASFHDDINYYFLTSLHMHGDLECVLRYRGALPLQLVQFYTADLILTLSTLHSRGIIHRDIKPANILIGSDGHLVIADFGLAKIFPLEGPQPVDVTPYWLVEARDGVALGGRSRRAHTTTKMYVTRGSCGSPAYAAPERMYGFKYGFEVDYWSLGVVVYEMLTGRVPWFNEDLEILARQVVDSPLRFSSEWAIDPTAKDFLQKCLRKTPCERLSVDDMKAHAFFADFDWPCMADRTQPAPFIPTIPVSPYINQPLKPATRIIEVGKPYVSVEDYDAQLMNGVTPKGALDPSPDFTYQSKNFRLSLAERALGEVKVAMAARRYSSMTLDSGIGLSSDATFARSSASASGSGSPPPSPSLSTSRSPTVVGSHFGSGGRKKGLRLSTLFNRDTGSGLPSPATLVNTPSELTPHSPVFPPSPSLDVLMGSCEENVADAEAKSSTDADVPRRARLHSLGTFVRRRVVNYIRRRPRLLDAEVTTPAEVPDIRDDKPLPRPSCPAPPPSTPVPEFYEPAAVRTAPSEPREAPVSVAEPYRPRMRRRNRPIPRARSEGTRLRDLAESHWVHRNGESPSSTRDSSVPVSLRDAHKQDEVKPRRRESAEKDGSAKGSMKIAAAMIGGLLPTPRAHHHSRTQRSSSSSFWCAGERDWKGYDKHSRVESQA